ncbi:nudix-type nucleoside diphosphatase (YffH/AdpP family) [Paenibacillus phyllosphaerae]|uniref:Nudix-type nucleoside diphosphatase (YffH/AdpP family) n=1 Tax=Paenibacillus phyllosphaerae TaxID=274593 RepID=A0A7W5B245_9BACL|nr:GDP-mannose pyrophosphatase NudK [Paenibacillus phyllosphaerae]MBB3113025.1 nudix-type nucleoside diphosphatase (YffH/AdpP family) [Paenibacillus phyllosphaerae]
MDNHPRIRKITEEVLSDNWYVLKKVSFEYQKENGEWEKQEREVYDRGNGATILLYNRDKQTVVLTRQFRMPTYKNHNPSGMLIETCAGLLDQETPEASIIRETEEETGYKLTKVQQVGEAYMSPGSVTEIVHFYVGEYDETMASGTGGGLDEEQENIEVLELPFDHALEMIRTGEIRDGKTILLLQYAELHGLLGRKEVDEKERGPMHILVAGPYRSGTGDDPEKIEQNVQYMNRIALHLYEAGHMPVLGEWYALPLVATAGSAGIGDEIFNRIFHPSSERLLRHCDAVVRVGGPSAGADQMVNAAKAMGKMIYEKLEDIPKAACLALPVQGLD